MLDEYASSFKVKVDKVTLLADLEKARVLVKQDGNCSCSDIAHYFYYFLARFFKNNINGPDGPKLRVLLNSIAGGLNAGSNGIVLMFFVYLSHDDKLIADCVAIGDKILAEFAPSDFTKEVEFYNSKDFAGTERQIPESVDLQASRRRRRRAADLQPRGPETEIVTLDVESDGYADDLPLSTKFDYAFSCIEILGQILRNFTGSLPGEQKLEILRTTYLLGLRALKAMLMVLSDATVSAKEELAKLKAANPEGPQLIKRVEKLLTVIAQILGVYKIQTISLSVGSPDIEDDAYGETLSKVGRNNATELVDLSIRLDHSEEYPFNQISRLNREYASNRFAQRVLRDLVVANMHVFDIGQEMRQKVLATLKVKPDDAILSRLGKRLK